MVVMVMLFPDSGLFTIFVLQSGTASIFDDFLKFPSIIRMLHIAKSSKNGENLPKKLSKALIHTA